MSILPSLYDGMTEDRKAYNERNDCAVVAVAAATGVDYKTTHATFRRNGRRSRGRTAMSITFKVLKSLGAEVEQVVYNQSNSRRYSRTYAQNPGFTNQFRSNTVTTIEGEIQRKDPQGHYLIRTRGHILAFADGRIQDWTAGRRHRVIEVYRVQPLSTQGITTMAAKKTAKKTAPKTATKKAVKKAPVKKVTKKTTPAVAPKAKAEPKAKGLRKPQVRILVALSKSGKPLSRAEISEKATVDVATCTEYIGSIDEVKRLANDVKHFPSLISLGFIRFAAPEEGKGANYEITAAGKKAVA